MSFSISNKLKKHDGFSLVELSIVLVILGLLTGGILTGQSLIRAAEIRSVAADFSRYQTSIYTFRDKYFALPGDMRNATAFWGAADGAEGEGADCFDADVTNNTTCNGNGDGFINDPAGATGVWLYGERFSSWKHLANAGLIEGTYTGETDHASSNNSSRAGVNVPAGKISNSIYQLAQLNGGSTAYYNSKGTSNIMVFASTGGTWPLSPEEAWNVDTKLDDGRPGLGRLTSVHPTTHSGCADNADAALAEYLLANNAKDCSLAIFY